MPEKIIAIFIAYNAAQTLEKFYNSFPKELCDEILLVDDASKDGTFELAVRLGIQSYKNPVNLGYGGNLKRAINLALEHGADIVIDIHPDGEYKPSAIPVAIQEVQSGAEFILGNRFTAQTDPLKRGMFFWKAPLILLMNWIDKLILGIPVDDVHQGFRVYTRALLQKVNFMANSNDYLFSFELIVQAAFFKCRFAQVPVETNYIGEKRGASLKSSIKYSLKTFQVLWYFFLAKIGFISPIFKKPHASR